MNIIDILFIFSARRSSRRRCGTAPHADLSLPLLCATLLLTWSVSRSAEPRLGADASPKLLAYAERSKNLRYAAIATAPENVAAARARVGETKRKRYPSADAKRKAIERAQEKLERTMESLAKIEDPFEPYYAPIDPKKIKVGSVGRIDWEDAFVYQVVDRDNMLVEFTWIVPTIKIVDSSRAATEDNVYTTTENQSKLVWVRGIDTRKLVDRKSLTYQGINPDDVFEVTRSKTYGTAAGSLSVPMVEVKEMAPYRHLFNRTDEARIWKDITGKRSFEAIFVRHERGKVRLMSLQRMPKVVDLRQLSEADQAYIRDQIRAERQLVRPRQ